MSGSTAAIGVCSGAHSWRGQKFVIWSQTSNSSTTPLAAAAFAYAANEHGVEGLSMRRLARECGVGAMTLYGYVRTKDELLEMLLDRRLAAIELPAGDTQEWRERLADEFHAVRRTFHEHPELLPIVATH